MTLKSRARPARGKKSAAKEALGRIHGLESEIARILEGMQEKVQQLEYLSEFSALLNSALDTNMVREMALEATCKLLRCETASLLLVDAKKAELCWETALGGTDVEGELARQRVNEGELARQRVNELQRSVRLPIDNRSIAGHVAMSGESTIVNNESELARQRVGDRAVRFTPRNMVCVPLKTKDRVIGVLQALNKVPSLRKSGSGAAGFPANFNDDDRKMLETLSHQVSIAVENARLYGNLKKNFFETVEALAEAIEKKDRYTGGHTKRVVHYSMCIAKYLSLAPEELERIRLGALLHDVGKIGIEDKILKKQSPLESQEWEVMQEHPDLGYDIMSRVEGLKDVMGGMRFHHERWDGKGYPLGLKGEEIPLIARIISVADTYDAMVSTRPYRKGLDPQVAYDEIVKHRGSQFDPVVVDAFIEAFQCEKMGKGSGGYRSTD